MGSRWYIIRDTSFGLIFVGFLRVLHHYFSLLYGKLINHLVRILSQCFFLVTSVLWSKSDPESTSSHQSSPKIKRPQECHTYVKTIRFFHSFLIRSFFQCVPVSFSQYFHFTCPLSGLERWTHFTALMVLLLNSLSLFFLSLFSYQDPSDLSLKPLTREMSWFYWLLVVLKDITD